MNLDNIIASVLATATAASPGTLVHGANTYSVCKSYGPGDATAMLNAGYDPSTSDLVVLLKRSDIVGDGPSHNDLVTLDSVEHYVASPIIKTALYWQIPLRIAK